MRNNRDNAELYQIKSIITYHHFVSVSQNGNGTHEKYRHQRHEKLVPFFKDASRMKAIMIQITLSMIPMNLTKKVCTLEQKFVSTPKKALESLSIVLRPQKKPNNIPPRCVKLSTSGVRPMTIFRMISRTSHINTLM